ncbi:hypothetical protein [Streptomyces marokkonensis]|nr:hypothetical protein [Streptomyces marokkonensis]
MQTRILESKLSVLLIRKGTPEAARSNVFPWSTPAACPSPGRNCGMP